MQVDQYLANLRSQQQFINLSLDRVVDIVLSYENAADYIAKAFQKYGDTHRKLNNSACEKSKSIL